MILTLDIINQTFLDHNSDYIDEGILAIIDEHKLYGERIANLNHMIDDLEILKPILKIPLTKIAEYSNGKVRVLSRRFNDGKLFSYKNADFNNQDFGCYDEDHNKLYYEKFTNHSEYNVLFNDIVHNTTRTRYGLNDLVVLFESTFYLGDTGLILKHSLNSKAGEIITKNTYDNENRIVSKNIEYKNNEKKNSSIIYDYSFKNEITILHQDYLGNRVCTERHTINSDGLVKHKLETQFNNSETYTIDTDLYYNKDNTIKIENTTCLRKDLKYNIISEEKLNVRYFYTENGYEKIKITNNDDITNNNLTSMTELFKNNVYGGMLSSSIIDNIHYYSHKKTKTDTFKSYIVGNIEND